MRRQPPEPVLVRPCFPILWRPCCKCGCEFRWEPGWTWLRLGLGVLRGETVYLCAACAPDRATAEAVEERDRELRASAFRRAPLDVRV